MADEFSNSQSTKSSSSQIIRSNYQSCLNCDPVELVLTSNSEEIYKTWRQYIFLLYLFVFILYSAESTWNKWQMRWKSSNCQCNGYSIPRKKCPSKKISEIKVPKNPQSPGYNLMIYRDFPFPELGIVWHFDWGFFWGFFCLKNPKSPSKYIFHWEFWNPEMKNPHPQSPGRGWGIRDPQKIKAQSHIWSDRWTKFQSPICQSKTKH